MRISVVVTTFNQARYLAQTLESVLAQTLSPAEIIVVDDGSTDETPAVLDCFSGRVLAVRQRNTGVAGSRNAGVSRATGDLVALIDGDDLWHPEKLALQAEAWSSHSDSGLIAAGCLTFEDSPPLEATPAATDSDRHGGLMAELIEENVIRTTSQVAIPRAVLQAVGPSDQRYPTCSDYDLYLRIARRWPVTLMHHPLTFWRYHAASASGPQVLRELRWAPEMIAILRRAAATLPQPLAARARARAAERAVIAASRAYDYGVDFDRQAAMRHLWMLAQAVPGRPGPWLAMAGLAVPAPLRRVGARLVSASGLRWRA